MSHLNMLTMLKDHLTTLILSKEQQQKLENINKCLILKLKDTARYDYIFSMQHIISCCLGINCFLDYFLILYFTGYALPTKSEQVLSFSHIRSANVFQYFGTIALPLSTLSA